LQMEEITDQYDPAEMEQQKGLTIVAFLFEILFFLPILSNKDSAYAKTVANQALTIAAANIVVSILSRIIGKIPVLGAILGLVLSLVSIALVILCILKIVDAVNGKMRKLPFGFEISAFK
ncbi:MAG: hypothetical protein IKH50_01965, partial [Oscillospiraceae bacterium]|nr:hypothetical protein [Oscillospiraceae bacterium]